MTKTLAAIMGVVVLVGCGDPGGGPTGGADASVTCRAPAGCFAYEMTGAGADRCDYGCSNGDRVCVPIGDGGVVYPGALRPSGIPLSQIAGDPFAANFQTDRLNCGTCGNRCPDERRYCVRGLCSPTP